MKATQRDLCMSGTVDRPIFFVGVPRSGTSILFEAFSRHPALAWLSNYSRSRPGWVWLNGLRGLLDNRLVHLAGPMRQSGGGPIGSRLLPQPSEAYPFWEYWLDTPFVFEYLLNTRARSDESTRLSGAIRETVRWQRRKRFATKITGPGRIGFLHSIFPDARFVHVIRDGRAVANSLLNVAFWKQAEASSDLGGRAGWTPRRWKDGPRAATMRRN